MNYRRNFRLLIVGIAAALTCVATTVAISLAPPLSLLTGPDVRALFTLSWAVPAAAFWVGLVIIERGALRQFQTVMQARFAAYRERVLARDDFFGVPAFRFSI